MIGRLAVRRLPMPPAPLIVIVVVGIALRLINLADRPLWYDEAFAMLYARLPVETLLALPDLQHPPFYYLTLKQWTMVFGESAAGARALSLVYGVATIILAYLLMRELFDRRVGLIAALFVALSPYQIAFSQETRMYAQMGFWCTAALWAFVRGARTNRMLTWIAFGACGSAALYSHNLALAFLASIAIFMIARVALGLARRVVRVALLTGTLVSALVMIALVGPWLTRLLAQIDQIAQAYRLPPPTAVTFTQTLIAFGFWTDNQGAPLPLAAAMLAGSIFIVALIALEVARARRLLDARVGLLLTVFVVPIFLVALASYAIKPIYIIRGLIPSQIAFLLLAAWAASRMPRAARIGSVALLGAILVAAWSAHYAYNGFPRAPWSEVAAYLHENAAPDDAVIHDNRLTFVPMRAVEPGLAQVYVPDVIGVGVDVLPPAMQQALGIPATPLDKATIGRERAWLVLFSRTRDDYRAAGFLDDPVWVAIEEHFDVAAKRSFQDVDVYLFTRETKDD
jgi:uncharacterized membrane protein